MTSAKTSCSVCLEPFQPHTEATCDFCAQPYHLTQRQDIAGKDCGQVWINEEHLALEFACDTCLNPPVQPDGALADILTIEEAAELTGRAEADLAAAAAAGQLRHRRTAGGVYLFERSDLVSFSGTR